MKALPGGAVIMLTAALALNAQEPNLLVEVRLVGVGRITVEALLRDDSTLLLPARDVHALLGLQEPTSLEITPTALAERFPAVSVEWIPLRLLVSITDPNAVLPASRELRNRQTREARVAAPLEFTRGGPFMAVTADDSSQYGVEGGYSFGGRAAIHARHSNSSGTLWGVSLSPDPRLYLTYAENERSKPTATARLALGPTWLYATWQDKKVTVDGLAQLGRLSVFGSSRDTWAITLKADPVGVQVGQNRKRTTARVTWGPMGMSPFGPPVVP